MPRGAGREQAPHCRRGRRKKSAMSQMPLAVLDLAPISEGSTARQALQNTIDLAQSAERWGYRRCWVAEHHFVAVASSSPAVLIALIATATNTIRVGSAAVRSEERRVGKECRW